MTLEQVEVQIADFLTKAKKMQIRAKLLQRQGMIAARQGEVVVREKLGDYFEGGLSFLGKSIVKGRKIKESLAAETRRKMANLRKEETTSDKTYSSRSESSEFEGVKSELIKSASDLKSQNKMMRNKSAMKNKSKPKKSTHQFSNASRAR